MELEINWLGFHETTWLGGWFYKFDCENNRTRGHVAIACCRPRSYSLLQACSYSQAKPASWYIVNWAYFSLSPLYYPTRDLQRRWKPVEARSLYRAGSIAVTITTDKRSRDKQQILSCIPIPICLLNSSFIQVHTKAAMAAYTIVLRIASYLHQLRCWRATYMWCWLELGAGLSYVNSKLHTWLLDTCTCFSA